MQLNKSVLASASPTSYQLSVEDPDLEKRKRDYKQKLGRLPKGAADVVGYAFYVNGERNSVDTYASTKLFHQLWEKLLNIAILEAISAQNGKAAVPNKADVDVWLKRAAQAQPRDKKNAAPCTRLETKHTKTALFSTRSTRPWVIPSFYTGILSLTNVFDTFTTNLASKHIARFKMEFSIR